MGIVINRRHRTETDIDALVLNQIADIADRKGIDAKNSVLVNRVKNQIVAGFLNGFGAAKDGIFVKIIIAFKQKRVRAFPVCVILSPDECARPSSGE